MRVVFQNYGSGELGIVEVAMPVVRPGNIAIQTQASLVSAGTEKAMIDVAQKSLLGKALARPDWVKQVIAKIRTEGLMEAYRQSRARLDTPLPLGYSSAGIVAAVGRDVAEFAVGDRVACAGSGYASHAEVVSVPRNLCVKIPEQMRGGERERGRGRERRITFEEASFVALGGIALEAVRLARPEIGHRVAVIGLGLLGQLAVQILKANGCRVLGVDLVLGKLDLARDLGADVAIHGATDDVMAAVREFSNGYGADSVIILASTASNQPIEQAAEMCRERGRVVATGMVGLDIPRKPFYEKEIEFVISRAWGPGMYDVDYEERDVKYPLPYVRWTARRNMATFLDLVAEGRVNVEPLITHRFPFEQALNAYEMILEGEEPYIGVVLEYGEAEPEPVRRIDLKPENQLAAVEDDEVGIGLIGAGLYARGTLLPALQKVKGVRYVGVATASGMSGRHVGDKFGFEYCTTDCRSVLDDPGTDVVFILTRHGSHAHFVVEALRAGKHVFVEKPLALDLGQLVQVVETFNTQSSKFGTLLMVGFNRRFSPFTCWLKERFASVAEPLAVHYTVNAGLVPPDHWVHDPQQGGGRIIGEVCHFVDLIQYLAGSTPTRAYAETLYSEGYRPSDNVVITLKMANGAIGSITYAAGGDKRHPRERVEVFGGGAVGVIENFNTAMFTRGGHKTRIHNWFSVDRGHRGEVEALLNAIRTGSPAPVDLDEYIYTTLTTFAIEESLRQGEPVAIDLGMLQRTKASATKRAEGE